MGRQGAVDERLDAIEQHLASIEDQLLALREMAETQMDVDNQSTELLGRLLRSATDRIEDLEGRVGQAP